MLSAEILSAWSAESPQKALVMFGKVFVVVVVV